MTDDVSPEEVTMTDEVLATIAKMTPEERAKVLAVEVGKVRVEEAATSDGRRRMAIACQTIIGLLTAIDTDAETQH